MLEENKAVVCRIVEDLFNTGDASIADEVFAADYIDHTASNPQMRGPENVRQFIESWRAAFPDTRSAVDDIVAEGDRVAVRWTTHATHRGEFMGVAPTGRQVAVGWFGMFRLSDGRVVESWDTFNALEMMQQLGESLV
ncbi:MAG: ester cyclase [Actinomycetota bacterium]|nr:ester cyclase [Actinomycetota bacterium]